METHKITRLVAASLRRAAAPAVPAQRRVTLYGAVDNAIAYTNNKERRSNVSLRAGGFDDDRFGSLVSESFDEGARALPGIRSFL